MSKRISITDAELPIMKVLWEKGCVTSPEILDQLDGNKSTLKTLLLRLVNKGAVKSEEINTRTYRYRALITEDEYITDVRKIFLQKAFNGSAEKMLLNFVKEENITKTDLQHLISMIEED